MPSQWQHETDLLGVQLLFWGQGLADNMVKMVVYYIQLLHSTTNGKSIAVNHRSVTWSGLVGVSAENMEV